MAMSDGRWKCIKDFQNDRIELFDLKNDPGETENQYKDHADQAARMVSKLKDEFVQVPKSNLNQQELDEIKKRLDALGYL